MKRLLFLVCLLGLSVDSYGFAKKKDYVPQKISQGIYASSEASRLSRFDLSTKYINETKRLIAPPAHPIKIQALTEKTKDSKGKIVTNKVVVLPESAKGKIVVTDSPEYKSLVQNKSVTKQVVSSDKTAAKFTKDVDKGMKIDESIHKKNAEDLIKANKKIAELAAFKSFVTRLVVGFLLGIVILVIVWVFLKVLGIAARAAVITTI